MAVKAEDGPSAMCWLSFQASFARSVSADGKAAGDGPG